MQVTSAARWEPRHDMIDFICRGVKQGTHAVATPDTSKHQGRSEPTGRTATDESWQAPSAASAQGHSGCKSTRAENEAGQSTSGGDGRLPCPGPVQQEAPALPEVYSESSSRITDAAAVPTEAAAMSDMRPEEPQAGHGQLPAPTALAEAIGAATSIPAAAAVGQAAAAEASDQQASSSQHAAADESVMPTATPCFTPAANTQAAVVSMRSTEGVKSGWRAEGQQASAAAARPTQTAAEMLSWLDATLAAKKPVTGKATVMAPPNALKVPQAEQGQQLSLSKAAVLLPWTLP